MTESSDGTDSDGRGLAGHALVLFALTTAGFVLAFGLRDFLSGDWPWIMIEALPAAVAATTLLVGVVYAVRAGIDG
jgi:hypothetical protein